MTVEARTISFCGTFKKYLVNHSLFSQSCELAMAGPNKNVSRLPVKIAFFFSECRWFKKITLRCFFFSYQLFGGLLKAWCWISPPCRLKILFNHQGNCSKLL